MSLSIHEHGSCLAPFRALPHGSEAAEKEKNLCSDVLRMRRNFIIFPFHPERRLWLRFAAVFKMLSHAEALSSPGFKGRTRIRRGDEMLGTGAKQNCALFGKRNFPSTPRAKMLAAIRDAINPKLICICKFIANLLKAPAQQHHNFPLDRLTSASITPKQSENFTSSSLTSSHSLLNGFSYIVM